MTPNFKAKLSEWSDEFKAKKVTLKADLVAGLIVAIVALPLALGFAIASQVPPAMGIYTAIAAGFFAAIFGGSEYQVSGPTGAMVVVILSVASKHGIEGMIAATLIAGVILIALGLMKLGKIIEYIPSPVIVGFTAGIAFIIFFGQVNNFLGISPSYLEGAGFLEKTIVSLSSALQANLAAVLLSILSILILIGMPKVSKKVPGSIVAVSTATLLFMFIPFFHVVKTVGDIGKIPTSLPMPVLPHLTKEIFFLVLPAAFTIAALAAIESLLSAVVADSLTGTKHSPNKELVGQGIANIASALIGGLPATGAIARTATNVRNGAKSRLSAMFHAIFLLIIVLGVGALAAKIPLAALAGILMFTAFNMVEWERIRRIFKTPLSDVAVMLTTFALTVLVDLTVAIEVGMILASLLFMKRMSDLYKVEEFESNEEDKTAAIIRKFNHPDISIYTIHGPLFFGAASRFDQNVSNTPGGHKPIKIIRMKYVPVIDATGLNFLESTYKKHKKLGGVVLFSSVHPEVMKSIRKAGLVEELHEKHFFGTTKEAMVHALRHAKRLHKMPEEVTAEDLAKYDLADIDLDDKVKPESVNSGDPVEEILASLHIDGFAKVTRVGKKIMQKGRSGLRPILPKK